MSHDTPPVYVSNTRQFSKPKENGVVWNIQSICTCITPTLNSTLAFLTHLGENIHVVQCFFFFKKKTNGLDVIIAFSHTT